MMPDNRVSSSGSSSYASGFTHREYVDKWLALAVALTTFIGYGSSLYWERSLGPRLLLRREINLEREIDRLETEADAICTTSQLYEHSRLMRTAVVLRQELLQERRKRCQYEYSTEKLCSPLSTAIVYKRSAPGTGSGKQSGATPKSFFSSARPAPASLHQSPPSLTRTSQRAVCDVVARAMAVAESLWNYMRYNLLATVKYALRFGHILCFLYVFGLRPGLIVVPPSIEDTAHSFLTGVIVPYLVAIAMFGPTILFASQQATRAGKDKDSILTTIHAAVTSSNESRGAVESIASINPVPYGYDAEIHLCASNDLLWWFFCCICASYLVLRVCT